MNIIKIVLKNVIMTLAIDMLPESFEILYKILIYKEKIE